MFHQILSGKDFCNKILPYKICSRSTKKKKNENVNKVLKYKVQETGKKKTYKIRDILVKDTISIVEIVYNT